MTVNLASALVEVTLIGTGAGGSGVWILPIGPTGPSCSDSAISEPAISSSLSLCSGDFSSVVSLIADGWDTSGGARLPKKLGIELSIFGMGGRDPFFESCLSYGLPCLDTDCDLVCDCEPNCLIPVSANFFASSSSCCLFVAASAITL